MATAAGAVAVVVVTPNQMRGQTVALYMLTNSLFGLTIGPTGVAMLTDFLFADENMLHWSLGLVGGISATFSIFFLGAALKPYRAGRQAQEPEQTTQDVR